MLAALETASVNECERKIIIYVRATIHSTRYRLNWFVIVLHAYTFSAPCSLHPGEITRSPAVAKIADRTGCQWLSRSPKDNNNFHVIWKPICDFLSVINSNLGLYCFLSSVAMSLSISLHLSVVSSNSLLLWSLLALFLWSSFLVILCHLYAVDKLRVRFWLVDQWFKYWNACNHQSK